MEVRLQRRSRRMQELSAVCWHLHASLSPLLHLLSHAILVSFFPLFIWISGRLTKQPDRPSTRISLPCPHGGHRRGHRSLLAWRRQGAVVSGRRRLMDLNGV